MAELSKLLGEEGEEVLGSLVDDFTAAIRESDPNADGLTTNQIRERFEVCAKWWRILRYDLGWSKPRIRDHLGTALRAEMAGIIWEPPDTRRSWVR